jgi:hypothetical protein
MEKQTLSPFATPGLLLKIKVTGEKLPPPGKLTGPTEPIELEPLLVISVAARVMLALDPVIQRITLERLVPG